MVKKTIIGAVLVMMGLALGGLIYYLAEIENTRDASGTLPPVVSNRLAQSGRAFANTVNFASPAVVNISTTRIRKQTPSYTNDPFFEFFDEFFSPHNDLDMQKKFREQNLGSGIIVTDDGYIITNNHVVSGAEKIKVTLYDNRVFKGEVIGADPKTDIAVVKISARDLRPIPWGDSDNLQVGEFVLAIGNPFGLSHTVTMGIISAVGRADVGIADYEDFIQTDAAINPGNSGGPLVSTDGHLIGINTALFTKSGGYQGIGFAVPSNMARMIMEQLITNGKVVRGWLGVTIQELVPGLSEKFGHKSLEGALVGEVIKDSPAEKSGIKRGDIILEFGGKKVLTPATLRNLVATSRPGEKAPVKLLRSKKLLRIMVTVGELPHEFDRFEPRQAPESYRDVFSGLDVRSLTEDIARQLNLQSDVLGAVVVSVEEGSPAHEAGLRRGDVILEIDGTRIRDYNSFMETASGMRHKETVMAYVNRSGRKFYTILRVS
jgi:serine protease Do